MVTLRATLLGSFRLWQDDQPLEVGSTRLKLLLAYLLLNSNRSHPRQEVAFLFWPESTDAQARTNLRKALFRLRRRWPDTERFLHISAQAIGWRDDFTLNVDVTDFRNLINRAESAEPSRERERLLNEAMEMGRGVLLPGHYEEWIIAARERHRQRYLAALNGVVTLQEARRAYGAAIATGRRLLEIDPLHEEGYRRLMRLHALSGDRAGALRVYHTAVSQLREELDVEPVPATRHLYEKLLRRETEIAPTTPQRIPLVGREDAWRRLQIAWRVATQGTPQAVLISGEAGIGKTRLADEMRQWATRQGYTVLHAACYAAEQDVPYAPLAGWLRSDAVQDVLDTLDDVWLVELSRLVPEIGARFSHLQAPKPLETPWQRRHLLTAILHAVQASGAPLLLFVDDLHWSDPESIALLAFLLRHRHPLLFMGTARDEEVDESHPLRDWQRELLRRDILTPIPLDRLDLQSTIEVAGHAGTSLTGAEAERFFMETEGNPLFVVEWVRSGAAGGPPSSGSDLPDRVHALLELRLSRLSGPARELARGAALIGRSFTGRLLAAAGELKDEGLVDALDELWRQQIIREQGVDAYDFTHNKLRQVAAATLPPGQKRRWHRRIIVALHQQHAEDLRPVHDQLARHYQAVGQLQEAITHYRAAARAASRVFAHREAIAHLRRALALADPKKADGSRPAGPETIAALYEALGDALALRGNRPAARRAYRAALDRQETPRPRAELWLKIGQTRLRDHDYREVEASLERATTALGELSVKTSSKRWKTWLDIQLTHIDRLYFQARLDELDALCEQIDAPILEHGDAAQKASYFTSLVMAAHRRQRFVSTDRDVSHQRQALAWARESGQFYLVTQMTFSLGFTLLCGNALAEAAAALEEAVARSAREGNRPVLNQSLAYLSITRRFQGDESRVRELMEQTLPVATAEENPLYLGVARANEAWLAYRAGDLAAASRRAQQALKQWADLAYPFRGLAHWPRLAAGLAAEQWTIVRGTAHAIIDPEQREVSATLSALLDQLRVTPEEPNLHAELLMQARAAGYL